MRIVVTGATGLIGHALTDALLARGDQVVALSRDQGRARAALGARVQAHTWSQPAAQPPPAEALAGADAVVHLLGEPIDQRWTERAKREIRDSRVLSTRALAHALKELPDDQRPRTLVSQSAAGFYGARGGEPLNERTPAGTDFLAEVVVAWEHEAQAAAPPMRVVRTRTGVVLSSRGGALARMLPFFRLGVGGPVAGGRQYVSWVQLDDVAGAIMHAIDDAELAGPVNLTAPNPVTNGELSRALGRVLRRPAVLPVPAAALRLLYGEMAQVVISGQRVVPARLRERGYPFRYAQIEPALRDALGRA